MNSDGEKMPPDAPEPRLTEVANSLAANSSASSAGRGEAAGQDRLDGRVADALDVVVAGAAQAARRSARRPAACRRRGADTGSWIRSKRSSAKMQAADESGRRDARSARRARHTAAAQPATPGARDVEQRVGTAKAGCRPKKMRPMKVAVPVASATGRKVRALTSGIISSMANMTPPIGVLKVAAMPAPAPAATSVMRCHGAMRIDLAERRAERRADLDDRPFAADRGAAADRQRRGQRFDHRDDRPDDALAGSRSRP